LLTQLICAPGENAGLFSTNFPAKGWLSYEKLQAHRQDLIMINLTGRRDGGSEVDYTVNPQIGLPFMTGPTHSPDVVNHVFPAWDFISGQMIAVGMLAAERHRRLSGEGQLVRLALKDVALAMLGNFGMLAEVMVNDTDRPRQGNYLYGAFGRDFETLDGKHLMVVGLTDMQWQCLTRATGLQEAIAALGTRLGLDLEDEGNRFRARQQIAALMEPWFHARTLAEAAEILNAHRVTWGPYRSVREALACDPDCSVDNPLFTSDRTAGHRVLPDAGHAARIRSFTAPAGNAGARPRRAYRPDSARHPRLERSRSRPPARSGRRRRARLNRQQPPQRASTLRCIHPPLQGTNHEATRSFLQATRHRCASTPA
jgi:2-methylfumaryl-CoA isomerase